MFNTKEFKKDLITKRCLDLEISLDKASKEIGISKATLNRLEHSKLPDIETFFKVCKWLGTSPNKYYIKYFFDEIYEAKEPIKNTKE